MLKNWKPAWGHNSITRAHLDIMGVKSTDDINNWYKKARNGTYRIDGIGRLCAFLLSHKDTPIYIFGDYDVDGICACAILYLALAWLGFKKVVCRIPHRFSEGFGMSKAMVDEITEDYAVIVTVDNGIAAHDTIRYAKEKGYTVFVTDHHEPVIENGKTLLPPADMIIDPKAVAGSADFDGYCGAGIAYKIAKRLLGEDKRSAALISLAALATVCDQVEIVEENYFFVRDGLAKLNLPKPCCVPGLDTLGKTMGITTWDETAFGFKAGPAINAPERMADGGAAYSLRLLTTGKQERCRELAAFLNDRNEERKNLVKEASEAAFADVQDGQEKVPFIVYLPGVNEGIIGIVAGSLAEKYGVPAAVFTDSDDPEVLKGSFRTAGEYNVKEHLDMCPEYFVRYGGHKGAAGASVRKDMFAQMCDALQACSKDSIEKNAEDRTAFYDVEIQNDNIEAAIKENEKFKPFGNENRDLVFKINGFRVIPSFGEIKKKLKGNGIKLHSMHSDAVGFGLWELGEKIEDKMTVTLYGQISYNRFNGRVTPQITICDIEF